VGRGLGACVCVCQRWACRHVHPAPSLHTALPLPAVQEVYRSFKELQEEFKETHKVADKMVRWCRVVGGPGWRRCLCLQSARRVVALTCPRSHWYLPLPPFCPFSPSCTAWHHHGPWRAQAGDHAADGGEEPADGEGLCARLLELSDFAACFVQG
jgi:hypothetical protein